MTSMYDPETANFLFTWVIYREGPALFVQNHMLFIDQTRRTV